jgi:small subunit ribosomal protein S1
MVDQFDNLALLTDEEQEFAQMFADMGPGDARPQLEEGQMVKGKLLSIGQEVAFVDLGGKAEGVIASAELLDMEISVGEELEAIVISMGAEIRLSRTLAAAAADKALIGDAAQMGLPVQGKISGRNKGGFEVTIAGMQGFMPLSHLDISRIEDDELDAWIGRTERFLILEYDPPRKFLVSRAQLLRREREEAAEKIWDTLAEGQVHQGTVRSVMDYGCFVDIGGIDGLVHVREMSWSRVGHPNELVKSGDEVTVCILEVDKEKKRVGLSMKSDEADPWKVLGSDVVEGDLVDGEVTRLERYGAFVEILPGVEGLVHVSEITHLQHVRHPNMVLKPGQAVKVLIQQIDILQRRVSLSMKAAEGDPWADVATDYPIGSAIRGTVERCAAFGIFVQVGPGVTALLPGSETTHPRGTDFARHYKPGDPIMAVVLSTDPEERRMSISTRAAGDAEEAGHVADWKGQNRSQGFGTFAELLGGVDLKK